MNSNLLNPTHGAYDKSIRRVVRAAGFTSDVTTISRRIRPQDWGREYQVPRIDAATKSIT